MSSWSRQVQRIVGGSFGVSIEIPANHRRLRYLGLGPAHTAGLGLITRANSSLEFPDAPSAAFDQPLILGPGAPYILPTKGFDGPATVGFGSFFPAESTTVFLCHPVVDVLWGDEPFPMAKRNPFYFERGNAAEGLLNGQTIYIPTFHRRTVKLTLINSGAGASTTRVDIGFPLSPTPFLPSGGTTVRLQKTFAIAVGGVVTMQWGDGYAPAPDTPAAGENGSVPMFLKIGETGATALTSVFVEAYD